MDKKIYTVLFLCTGNSARSILAESIINHYGAGRFRGFSAGSQPAGHVHPLALALLTQSKLPSAGLRSKSWNEFSGPSAPPLNFVITLCDRAAAEACPYWPGQPMSAHWGMPDPAAVTGSELERMLAFRQALNVLETRIKLLLSLPLASIERMQLQQRMHAIGRTPAPG